MVGRVCWGKSELEDRSDEKRVQTFNRHVSFSFLLLSISPFVWLRFRSSQFLTFGLQLRLPAGAFLDRHYYNFSKYSIGILVCVAQCQM